MNKQIKQYEIPSETKDNLKYLLRKTKEGWKCSCPAFVFRNHCKHIDRYIKDDKFIG